MTRSLLGLADRLRELAVPRVMMEATSDYGKPVFYILEAQGLDPWLVNAKDVKHLPGRPKTDMFDAVWLAKVAERQMLGPSFVPPAEIRLLRDLIRYRADLVDMRTAEKNRVEKLLEDAQIKLSVVASDIFGVSGREMMTALIAVRRSSRSWPGPGCAPRSRFWRAFVGHFTDHHAFLLRTMLARIDEASADIAAGETRIEEYHRRARDDRRDRGRRVPVPYRRASVFLGPLRPLGEGVRRPEEGSRRDRAPQLLPRSGTGRGPRWPPARPTPSSGNATGASRGAEASAGPSSRSAARSWSSSDTCCPTLTPTSTTWARTSTTSASAPNARSATTSIGSKHSASR